eukprot:3504333-Prymnesium_polylepis.1
MPKRHGVRLSRSGSLPYAPRRATLESGCARRASNGTTKLRRTCSMCCRRPFVQKARFGFRVDGGDVPQA